MPLATLTIPLGIAFLVVVAGCCLVAYANARAIMRPSEEDDELIENWTWPAHPDTYEDQIAVALQTTLPPGVRSRLVELVEDSNR